ncbi:hypothetical protein DFH94DRAFT_778314 [Russula ochroleuca]|uniref:Secreted protein n=1 Tax=Russula ochroleuca TaxID=152965 RepID=A0A9P5JXM1_9AGAM|nr:hypothetical protein DFH94DRAFT_787232 [Russula ochroleuca]KAF8467584.1 hypothetical protein DFH94DRAFT_778314 [Russula ochroleuca]
MTTCTISTVSLMFRLTLVVSATAKLHRLGWSDQPIAVVHTLAPSKLKVTLGQCSHAAPMQQRIQVQVQTPET